MADIRTTANGMVTAPVLGPSAKHGRGSLSITPDGLAWTIRKWFKSLTGLVTWNLVTSWEAGLQRMGAGSAYSVFVTYENDPPGFIGLTVPLRRANMDEAKALNTAASHHLPASVVSDLDDRVPERDDIDFQFGEWIATRNTPVDESSSVPVGGWELEVTGSGLPWLRASIGDELSMNGVHYGQYNWGVYRVGNAGENVPPHSESGVKFYGAASSLDAAKGACEERLHVLVEQDSVA